MGIRTFDKTGLAMSNRLALSTALASIVLGGYGGRKAYAACTVGVPSTYTCSGVLTTTQSLAGTPLNVTTDPGFGIDTTATGGNAFTLTSTGGLTFTDNNTSTITGFVNGIYADNNGAGNLSITTNGAVEGTLSIGIYGHNNNTSGTDLLIDAKASVKGGFSGIRGRNEGTGSLTITTNGAIEGTTGSGIYGYNEDVGSTYLIIDAKAMVKGGWSGIYGRNEGTGVLSITSTGTVEGTSRNGIYARNNNTTSTDLTINTAAVTGGRYGIWARNEGAGVLSITSTGAVEGTSRYGIYAHNNNTSSTNLTINTAAVTGGNRGIWAVNNGNGTTTINTTGAVTGITGIRVDTRTNNSPATITSYAPITGTGGFAIDLRGDGQDVVNLGAGTVITGAIDFGNGNDGLGGTNPNDIDTLNALPGFNGVVTFADNQGDTDLESAPENVSSNVALINGGLTAVAVDPSGFAASGVFLGTFTSSIFNSIDNNGSGPDTGISTHQGPGVQEYGSGKRYWMSGLGGYQEVDGGTNYADLDHHFGGVMIGMENGFENGTAGFFGGYAVSDVSIQYGAGSTDVDTVFGGAYWKQDYGSHRIHLAFVGGSADHEFSRVVGGAPSTTALGKADGWFISPSATFIAPLNLFALPVEASVRASYAGLFLDGYTETGTAFPLSVSERNVHLFNTRAQLALPRYIANEDGTHSHFEVRAGVDARFDAGSDNVVAAVGGTSINFQAALDDEVSGFLGATMSRTSADGGFTFTLSGEMQSAFDGGYQATGEARAVFRF